jgi:four helix bundle protein
MNKESNELKARLVVFYTKISQLVEKLPKSKNTHNLISQLLRSASSPALNYAEAQFGTSKPDFIHKLRICLKELNETETNLRMLENHFSYLGESRFNDLIIECNELIAIFICSVNTAIKNYEGYNKYS